MIERAGSRFAEGRALREPVSARVEALARILCADAGVDPDRLVKDTRSHLPAWRTWAAEAHRHVLAFDHLTAALAGSTTRNAA